MWLFIGSSARRSPGSAAVYPSVQRSTERARTSPNLVLRDRAGRDARGRVGGIDSPITGVAS